eukprot:CAMPEP_0174290258 /NCGR_PEP_ID=MMETSP0809-20121228/28112_1 /TAXON_ID=73025 ORGANISM="Eutreptiella gymnastica-like, Strain CCMP1594" /NCGR_SAMPLE_ID=MMETSP0809 /ASSEMBLY_ACC=CAM_ASM_000658 /LENGTH=33 /DNA_ID= /DNA_START= /DNA_END= /DNA_ORIENTATION=
MWNPGIVGVHTAFGRGAAGDGLGGMNVHSAFGW